MKNTRLVFLSTALAGMLGAAAGPGSAQPLPPPPPGLPAPPMPDLHVRIVPSAPPPVRHEVVPERPSHHHVWVGGYWHHDGETWAWRHGVWVEPPRHHVHWVAAHYKKVHGGWQYVPGHWSHEVVIY
jgi:hypothetical protein